MANAMESLLLLISFLSFTEKTLSQSQCTVKGNSLQDGFITNGVTEDQCSSLGSYSYLFDKNFYLELSNAISPDTFTFNNIILFESNDKWINTKTTFINGTITTNSLLHASSSFIFGKGSMIYVQNQLSIGADVTFNNVIDEPRIIFLKITRFNMYKHDDNRGKGKKINIHNFSGNNKCFDFASLPSSEVIDYVTQNDDPIRTTDFPVTLDSGDKLILLSNKKLLRFCPFNTNNNTVECVMNGTVYSETFLENHPFNYPHCPCDSSSTTCSLRFDDSVDSVSFNNTKLEYTTVKINENKVMEINDLNKIQLISIPSNYDIRTYDSGRIKYYPSNTKHKDLEIEGNNELYISKNGLNGNSYKIIGSGTLNIKQFEDNALYIFENITNTNLKISYDGVPSNSILWINDSNVVIQNANNNHCQLFYVNDSKWICKRCVNNYYLINNKCVSNYNNCEIMNNNKGCVQCSRGYIENDDGFCEQSSDCYYGTKDYCVICKDKNKVNENGKCIENELCSKYCRNNCVMCKEGNITSKCSKCSIPNCKICRDDKCLFCENGYHYKEGQCVNKEEGEDIITMNTTISCLDGYYINEQKCEKCINKVDNTLTDTVKCNKNFMYTCPSNYYFDNGECILNGSNKDQNGKNAETIDNCKEGMILNGKCVECSNPYNLTENGQCADIDVYGCEKEFEYSSGCKRCKEGYFLNETYQCSPCDTTLCKSCYSKADFCTSCKDNYFVSNNTCKDIKELEESCFQISDSGDGCYICKEGYFREGSDCSKCSKECLTCNSLKTCDLCKEDYYKNNKGDCALKREAQGCDGEIDSANGCSKCQDKYYKIDKECFECPEECSTCYDNGVLICLTCEDDHVLRNGKCVQYKQIEHCTKASESKCSKCSFWHKPNKIGNECNSHVVWWVIVLVVLFVILIILLIIGLVIFIVSRVFKYLHKKEVEKLTTIFEMKRSNIDFIDIGNDIVSNTETLILGEDGIIPVEKETRSLLCIGNKSKKHIKIQLTLKEENAKYSMRVLPNVITLQTGQACEFEIFVTAHCTCKLKEQMVVISKSLKNADKEKNSFLNVKITSEISSHIDPDEIIEEKKIGEGSFGIVFIGTFRENKVAIKKMKNIDDTSKALKEFEKEVSMLDKFRSEYIIHFYGASFIPNRVCMVTEFAIHGSLKDLMRKRKESPISNTLKMRIILNTANGLLYLHNNGIYHRDIKPDNVLITSLNKNQEIIAKLTDFGSSRNINMLMTNMTFTRGVGTPVFMAPEILNKQKYNKYADVFSFSITMYECFAWEDCYPKILFKFPWDIAEFVSTGKRRPKPENVTEELFELIERCWDQEPQKRPTMEQIIKELKKLN